MLHDGDLAEGWVLQRALGVLADLLTRGLGVVERLSAMAQARSKAQRDSVT